MLREEIRKQFQPRIVTEKDESALATFTMKMIFDLSQPCVLACKGRTRVAFGKVQDQIHERRHRTGREALDTGHGHRRRSCIRGEGQRGSITNQAMPQVCQCTTPGVRATVAWVHTFA